MKRTVRGLRRRAAGTERYRYHVNITVLCVSVHPKTKRVSGSSTVPASAIEALAASPTTVTIKRGARVATSQVALLAAHDDVFQATWPPESDASSLSLLATLYRHSDRFEPKDLRLAIGIGQSVGGVLTIDVAQHAVLSGRSTTTATLTLKPLMRAVERLVLECRIELEPVDAGDESVDTATSGGMARPLAANEGSEDGGSSISQMSLVSEMDTHRRQSDRYAYDANPAATEADSRSRLMPHGRRGLASIFSKKNRSSSSHKSSGTTTATTTAAAAESTLVEQDETVTDEAVDSVLQSIVERTGVADLDVSESTLLADDPHPVDDVEEEEEEDDDDHDDDDEGKVDDDAEVEAALEAASAAAESDAPATGKSDRDETVAARPLSSSNATASMSSSRATKLLKMPPRHLARMLTSAISRQSLKVHELFVDGQYADALTIAEGSLVVAELEVGRESADTLYLLLLLTVLYHSTDRIDKAVVVGERALALQEAKDSSKDNDAQLIRPLRNLAELYSLTTTHYRQADALRARANEIQQRLVGSTVLSDSDIRSSSSALVATERKTPSRIRKPTARDAPEASPVHRGAAPPLTRVVSPSLPPPSSSTTTAAGTAGTVSDTTDEAKDDVRSAMSPSRHTSVVSVLTSAGTVDTSAMTTDEDTSTEVARMLGISSSLTARRKRSFGLSRGVSGSSSGGNAKSGAGSVLVGIVSAKGLRRATNDKNTQLYCVVCVDKSPVKGTTKLVSATSRTPQWNERFVFYVEDFQRLYIMVKSRRVGSESAGSEDSCIGAATFNMGTLRTSWGKTKEAWIDVEPQGRLRVNITPQSFGVELARHGVEGDLAITVASAVDILPSESRYYSTLSCFCVVRVLSNLPSATKTARNGGAASGGHAATTADRETSAVTVVLSSKEASSDQSATSPTWNERLDFYDVQNARIAEVLCWARDTEGDTTLLGRGMFLLSVLHSEPITSLWVDVEPRGRLRVILQLSSFDGVALPSLDSTPHLHDDRDTSSVASSFVSTHVDASQAGPPLSPPSATTATPAVTVGRGAAPPLVRATTTASHEETQSLTEELSKVHADLQAALSRVREYEASERRLKGRLGEVEDVSETLKAQLQVEREMHWAVQEGLMEKLSSGVETDADGDGGRGSEEVRAHIDNGNLVRQVEAAKASMVEQTRAIARLEMQLIEQDNELLVLRQRAQDTPMEGRASEPHDPDRPVLTAREMGLHDSDVMAILGERDTLKDQVHELRNMLLETKAEVAKSEFGREKALVDTRNLEHRLAREKEKSLALAKNMTQLEVKLMKSKKK